MTTTTTQFSMSALMRECIQLSESENPDVWVAEIMAAIPDVEEALRQLIRARISAEASTMRRRPAARVEQPVNRGPYLSPFVMGINEEFWPSFLEQRILGVAGWIKLKDAGTADLEAAAGRNEEQAKALLKNANTYRKLVTQMEVEGVERLGDLHPMTEEELS